jgi:hypothetical protein
MYVLSKKYKLNEIRTVKMVIIAIIWLLLFTKSLLKPHVVSNLKYESELTEKKYINFKG